MIKAAPKIGLIVPPAQGFVPPEPGLLFPDVEFVARGLGLTEMTPDGYDRVIDRVGELAKELAAEGAQAVSLMGTSLSFYQGPDFNRDLISVMEASAGVPSTTMTQSVVEALEFLGADKLAVATAYGETVNTPLRTYLAASGFTIETLHCLDIRNVEDVFEVTDQDIIDLAGRAVDEAPDAQALFISCGGLQTATITEPIETRHGLPVVSSAMAGAWGAARLAGITTRCEGFGRLFHA